MFTGIIEHTGSVHAINPTPTGRELFIDAGGWGSDFAPGESISINGCCLTLAPAACPSFLLRFDVVPETLARTTMGSLASGARVNLERAATASTLMGGHVVQGHVEGVGSIRAIRQAGECRITAEAPVSLMPFITPKGSIAVEGVSLTIASVDVAASIFDIALIPTTLGKTTLGALRTGSLVNLETDILARTVIHYLRNFAQQQR